MTRRITGARRKARALTRLVTVASLLLVTTAAFAPEPAGATSDGSSANSTGAVTRTRTVSRTFLDDGKTTKVDSRKITLKVAQTTKLRSLQLIHVTWSGAHETGAITSDVNSDYAQNEEYPFALFECRGADSSAHPLTPETCWTQYADERYFYDTADPSYPAWRSDVHASAAQRAEVVDQPSHLPKACTDLTSGFASQRWLPFTAYGGHTYAGGPQGCAGQPAEAAPENLTGSLVLPSNETFGVTDSHGDGATDFDVFTGQDHGSLGCSPTVACSLVAVPIEGISCDAAGAELPQPRSSDDADAARTQCEKQGQYAGRQLPQNKRPDLAVSGQYWWSASNWDQRISVPLHFAPPDVACASSAGREEDVYGSELMIQATTSWGAHFCGGNLFNFNHVQVPEPQARTLLANGGVSAAFTSDPPDTPYSRPTVNAPVAFTGFGISFNYDGGDGGPLTSLKLDARLLAKLLTESYPDVPFIRDNYAALANNPYNISEDPEFQALNPGLPQHDLDSAATLLTVNSDSDVMAALTGYIDADPEARAWLDGTPDPWGMVVNPNYKKIALPTNSWPLLDTFEPTDEYQPGRIDCLYADPVPYLPLVAAPVSRLFTIGQDMQFSLVQSQTTCVHPSPDPNSLDGVKMVAKGRQGPGARIMFGVVSLADAQRDGLTLASLETHTSDSAPAKFANAQGRTFVAPTDTSLRAAARALQTQRSTQTYDVPYKTLRDDSGDSDAYPGAMVVNAAIPTIGLTHADAVNYGKFLTFTAGAGQQAGDGQAQLPAGYLPMTSANGLGRLAAYTSCAAKAVAAQRGTVPSVSGTCPNATSGFRGDVKDRGGSGAGGGSAGSSGAGAGAGTGGPATNGSAAAAENGTTPGAKSSASSSPNTVDAVPASASTPSIGSTLSGVVLPILFLLALVGFLAALGMRLVAARKGAS